MGIRYTKSKSTYTIAAFAAYVVVVFVCSCGRNSQEMSVPRMDSNKYIGEFSIQLDGNGVYSIHFDKRNTGTLRYTKDTVFILYDNDLLQKWRVLFLKDNYQFVRDTVLLHDSSIIYCTISPGVFTNKFELSNTNIYIQRLPAYVNFNIYYSFAEGVVQVTRGNSVLIEVFNKYNNIKHVSVNGSALSL